MVQSLFLLLPRDILKGQTMDSRLRGNDNIWEHSSLHLNVNTT